MLVNLIFIVYPLLCYTIDSINWSTTNKFNSNYDFKDHKKMVYEKWFNPTHGLELSAGVNKGERYNEKWHSLLRTVAFSSR